MFKNLLQSLMFEQVWESLLYCLRNSQTLYTLESSGDLLKNKQIKIDAQATLHTN